MSWYDAKPKQLWRRFRPQRAGNIEIVPGSLAPLYRQAADHVHQLYPGRRLKERLISPIIQSVRDRARAKNDPMLWIAALILQSPRAVAAQQQMDKHPHGYHNKQARLYELIDFNDTYVSAVLSMPEADLPSFVDEVKRAMDVFCKQLGVRAFSDEQYEAIVHGLSREIAVFRGAIKEGFSATMTSRAEDAKGVDMIIADPLTGKSINIDCKTHSSYYYRLKQLVREGRMTTEQAGAADLAGYCVVVNGHDNERVRVVLWRIDEETYGTVTNFSFENTAALGRSLHEIIASVAISD